MNLNKLKLYTLSEIFQLVKISIGSRLIASAPKGLRKTNELVDTLLAAGTKVESHNDSINFSYAINEQSFQFQLKRNSSDALVFQQIILYKEYKCIVDFFMNNNISLNHIIDAGANIGMTSIYLKAFFPKAKIIALEPSDNTYHRLENNIKKNNFSDVTCLQKGLWSHKTFLSPDTSFRDKLDWSFKLVETKHNENGAIEVLAVGDMMKDYQLDGIDFLKIDIEGGETAVFGETADLSWLHKVKVIAIEIHDEFNCRPEIEGKLKHFGFSLSYTGELTIGINNKLLNLKQV